MDSHPARIDWLVNPYFSILIVASDCVMADEILGAASRAAYRGCRASNWIEACKVLEEKPDIGIVVFDADRLSEKDVNALASIREKAAATQPIILVATSANPSLAVVRQAMHWGANDFLLKPAESRSVIETLRRASRTRGDLGRKLALKSALDGKAEKDYAALDPDKISDEMAMVVKWFIRQRERRHEFFDHRLFSDPNWDILLTLMAAKLEGKPLPVSSACTITNLPLSTALRYVGRLVSAGLVNRWKDPSDRRRDLVELNSQTAFTLARYFVEVRGYLQ